MITIRGEGINNMTEAYDILKEMYKDKPLDIWFRKSGVEECIFVEPIFNATLQRRLASMKDVKDFIDNFESFEDSYIKK